MRKRLALVLFGTTAVVVLAFVIPLALLVREVAHDSAIADADRDASSLFPALAVAESHEAIEIAVARTESGAAGRLAVYLRDGMVIGAELPENEGVRRARDEGRAWHGAVKGGTDLVVPVVHGDGTVDVIQVFVPSSELTDGVGQAWISLAVVGSALLLVSVVLAERVSRSVASPVADLATASRQLARGELDARVDPSGPPEIVEMGQTFNHLATRVSELLDAEREDVADLAHRLRTPLAALRLQLDQIADLEVRSALSGSADQLARSLDQVILEARRRSSPDTSVADLVVVLRDRFDFWAVLAEEQDRPARLDLGGVQASVRLGVSRLADGLDVIFENVFAHTEEGVGYAARLRLVDRSAELTITDDGVGFKGEGVTQRGSTSDSTGLGLDIARRAVEDAGGTFAAVTLPAGGACVSMTFPIV